MDDFGDTDTLLEHNDIDDERNIRKNFQPDYNSTPGPSGEEIPRTKMNKGQKKASENSETSFIEGDTTNSRVWTSNENALCYE